MHLKQELLSYAKQHSLDEHMKDVNFDVSSIAIEILEKIQQVLIESTDDEEDFYTVDKIVCIFYEYDLDCGGCHDFG